MHRIVMLSERLHASVADRTAPETSGAPWRVVHPGAAFCNMGLSKYQILKASRTTVA